VLKNKKIIVAVTASVAAYKSIELVRELKNQGASVRVITTPDALRFVTRLSLQVASENEVIHDMFSNPLSHIELPRWGDLLIVAPVTANTIAKFSSASASDMVSACFLAFQGPVIIAPAMNWRMYSDTILQEKLLYLKSKGVIEVAPESGVLACGEEGMGRLASIDRILTEAARVLSKKDFAGKKIVVTAGPTREYLDPVRFITNRSSGKMGFSISRCAYLRGADVVLVTGPVCLAPPHGIRTERIETSLQMHDAVMENMRSGADVLIMAAAVSDYTPLKTETAKMDKANGLKLEFTLTRDIISEVSHLSNRPMVVGFAAETGNNRSRAMEKMLKKGMDMVVFNNVSLEGAGFDTDTNQVALIDRNSETEFPLMSKDEVAMVILDKISEMIS
jgi:phosphopantothenoylcysteine decarboxylase/phosphopantothenate--cysteine ligase